MNFDGIKYVFQMPLSWFRKIDERIENAYGVDFVSVKTGDYGGLEISLDQEQLENYIKSIVPKPEDGGVKSVDNILPGQDGNVSFGLQPNKWLVADALGHISYTDSDPVTVDEYKTGLLYNDLGTLEYKDKLGEIKTDGTFEDCSLNCIVRTKNGKITHSNGAFQNLADTDDWTAFTNLMNQFDWDVSTHKPYVVKSVNGQSPVDGNVQITVPDVNGMVKSINTTYKSDKDGNVNFPAVMTINGDKPDDNGNIDVAGTVTSVNDVEPDDDGNVDLGEVVYSVDGVEAEDGNVKLGAIRKINGLEADEDGTVDLSQKFPLTNEDGTIATSLPGNKWVVTGSNGSLTTTDDDPITTSGVGVPKVDANGNVSWLDDKGGWVTLSSEQTIEAAKNWDKPQTFRIKEVEGEYTKIDGSSVSLYSTPVVELHDENNTMKVELDESVGSVEFPYVAIETSIKGSEGDGINVKAKAVKLDADKGQAQLNMSPDDDSPDNAIATVKYVKDTAGEGKYVTLDTVQKISGTKVFSHGITLAPGTDGSTTSVMGIFDDDGSAKCAIYTSDKIIRHVANDYEVTVLAFTGADIKIGDSKTPVYLDYKFDDDASINAQGVASMGWTNDKFIRKSSTGSGLVYTSNGTVSYKPIDAEGGVAKYDHTHTHTAITDWDTQIKQELNSYVETTDVETAGTTVSPSGTYAKYVCPTAHGHQHTAITDWDDNVGDVAKYDTLTVGGVSATASGSALKVDFSLGAEKWVKTDASGKLVTSDDNPITIPDSKKGQSKDVTVVTGVTWNGKQIVVASSKLSFTNGVLTGVTSQGNKTIETVAYNPS